MGRGWVDGWGRGALIMLRSFLRNCGLAKRFAGMFAMMGQMGVGGVTRLVMGTQRGRVECSSWQGRGCCSDGAVGVLAKGKGYLTRRGAQRGDCSRLLAFSRAGV